MKIYELCRCDEYWMQESISLHVSKESALKSFKGKHLVVGDIILAPNWKEEENENWVPVALVRDEMCYPKEKVIVTPENLAQILDKESNGFYDIIHANSDLYGIFEREVLE